MAEIILFHHAQGLTPGVVAIADRLRAAGHHVHTPDLYDSYTFKTLEEGMGYARSVGFDNLLDAGVAAGEALPADLVYAGFSLGVMPAQKLVQTRPGARGALLFDACIPLGEFVPSGKAVGLSGSTGYSTGPHAHVMRMQDCGAATSCQSIAVKFADVPGSGVPTAGQTVTSKNGCP